MEFLLIHWLIRWMENREWVLIRTDALFPDRKGNALFPENAGEAIWHQSKNEAASREVTDYRTTGIRRARA